MDNNNNTREVLVGTIRAQLKSGELTYGMICQRLEASVYRECDKPESKVNYTLLESCQNALDILRLPEPYVI